MKDFDYLLKQIELLHRKINVIGSTTCPNKWLFRDAFHRKDIHALNELYDELDKECEERKFRKEQDAQFDKVKDPTKPKRGK